MIKIHKEPIIVQLLHIPEVIAILKFKYNDLCMKWQKQSANTGDVDFCYFILNKVSRSFAGVIKQLPKDLSKDIMIFYLVLRALDTVEDDVKAFNGDKNLKSEYLINFHTNFNNIDGIGEKFEKTLLQKYERIGKMFSTLKVSSQEIIKNITKRMAEGMVEFLGKEIKTRKEYNLYCFYVAGLVGEGLTKLFVNNNYESDEFEKDTMSDYFVSANHGLGGLDKSMGLFLQKTNIIRDYLEDKIDNKIWWPKEIWGKHVENFNEFSEPINEERALNCLNDMILDAMELVPDVLAYLNRIKNPKVFNFCAIPQVMAIATLNKCYNNKKVFTGIVKIRKGLAVRMINEAVDIDNVNKWFSYFTKEIKGKVRSNDPNGLKMIETCNLIDVNLGPKEYGGYILKIVSTILASIYIIQIFM